MTQLPLQFVLIRRYFNRIKACAHSAVNVLLNYTDLLS